VRFVWMSALKDLSRLRRDPLGLAAALAIPFVVTLLLNLVFGDGPKTEARLLLVDQDHTVGSAVLRRALNQGSPGKAVLVEEVVWDEGRRRMDQGDGSALLLIPEGFEKAVLRHQPCQLKLLTNPSQRILPGIIEESLAVLLEGAFYGQMLVGEPYRRAAKDRPPDQAVAESSIAFARLARKLNTYLDPPRIQLDLKVLEQTTSAGGIGVQFFPGMLLLSILLVGQSLSADLWKERAYGTLRRLIATPRRLEAFLAGKLLAAATVLGSVGAVGLVCGWWLLHLPIAYPLVAALWVLCAGLPLYLLQVLVNLYASSERAGNVITTLVISILGMVGGTYFPFEMMPGWLAAIGRLTPNGWAIVQLKTLLTGAPEPARLAASFVGAAVLCVLAILVAVRRLRRVFVF
jgi:ABC-2 type transport system permease protein